ncbi:hypothetical protein WN51_09896 [Melipona quadrifasciata]|uniref:SAP domain-containing protein n=1 Tax=Melipona quadrifasciata TaxID=166423 RepID=A0A0M9A991_9HYME|nr:hypothetical protein WN51_09896 [Melipona quadrifasciata]
MPKGDHKNLSDFTIAELKILLRERGIATGGSKTDLIVRLTSAEPGQILELIEELSRSEEGTHETTGEFGTQAANELLRTAVAKSRSLAEEKKERCHRYRAQLQVPLKYVEIVAEMLNKFSGGEDEDFSNWKTQAELLKETYLLYDLDENSMKLIIHQQLHVENHPSSAVVVRDIVLRFLPIIDASNYNGSKIFMIVDKIVILESVTIDGIYNLVFEGKKAGVVYGQAHERLLTIASWPCRYCNLGPRRGNVYTAVWVVSPTQLIPLFARVPFLPPPNPLYLGRGTWNLREAGLRHPQRHVRESSFFPPPTPLYLGRSAWNLREAGLRHPQRARRNVYCGAA